MSTIQNPKTFRDQLVRWFKKAGRTLPWRETRDPYAIWISEIMLQQTQVVTVLDYYKRWLARFPDFAALANASEADVLGLWQGLGYYSRARNLRRAAQIVMQEHGGKMPSDPEIIRRLPGIGRYTAGAIATFAFDISTPIIDANIARVLARLLDLRTPIDSTKGQAVVWGEAEALQPERNARLFNSALMELGALVCLPRSPKCMDCPVKGFCHTSDPESLPVKKPRRKTVELAEHSAWIIKNGRILLEQQTGSRWRGLWKLPQLSTIHQSAVTGHHSPAPLLSLTYPFTHHRVTLTVRSEDARQTISSSQRWHNISELEGVALAAPHRRAIEQLLRGTNSR